jgi:hypothetical protein
MGLTNIEGSVQIVLDYLYQAHAQKLDVCYHFHVHSSPSAQVRLVEGETSFIIHVVYLYRNQLRIAYGVLTQSQSPTSPPPTPPYHHRDSLPSTQPA